MTRTFRPLGHASQSAVATFNRLIETLPTDQAEEAEELLEILSDMRRANNRRLRRTTFGRSNGHRSGEIGTRKALVRKVETIVGAFYPSR